MQATMIKIEMNTRMEKAIERCKAQHPKVRRVDASTVRVFGKGGAYTVHFAEPRKGLKLACCDCKASASGLLCYHIPAALVAPFFAPQSAMVPTPAPVVTLPAQSACTRAQIVERIEQTIGGGRVKAVYVDGWSV